MPPDPTRQAPVSKIRVLHLVTSLRLGGAERQLVTLLGAMDRTHFEHTVASIQSDGPLAAEIENLGLPLIHLDFRQRHLARTLVRLHNLMRDRSIDVVHAHLHLAAVLGRVASVGTGVERFFFTEHSDVASRSRVARWTERALRQRTTRKIAVSEAQRQNSIHFEHYAPDAVITIENSIPTASFARDAARRARVREEWGLHADHVVVGNVANHTDQKRIDRLIDRFAHVAKTRESAVLVLVGDGPLHADLRARASETGLGERILFLGRRLDVANVLAGLDVFAITSRWEGLPINLLEAMGASLPVVATDVGGIAQTLDDGASGFVFDQDDATSYQGALARLLDDESLRESMGHRGRAIIEAHHDADRNARRLERLYRGDLDPD